MADIHKPNADDDNKDPSRVVSDSDCDETFNAPRQPLTTKNALEYLLSGTLQKNVCRYCLNVTSQLLELDEVLQFGGERALYKITVKEIIAHICPFQVSQDPDLPNKICDICLDNSLRSYLFVQQCERSERALHNCFEDICDNAGKLDPLEQKIKRGRHKITPNHDKIFVEHDKVINYAEPIMHLVNEGSILMNCDNIAKTNNLVCPKCWQILPNVESLVNHEKIHPKWMWFHCHHCGKSFAKRLHLRKHVKSEHTNENNKSENVPTNKGFDCKICGDTSVNHQSYLQHIEKHKFKKVLNDILTKKNNDLCTICLQKGPKMLDLETRMSLSGLCPELNGDKSLCHIVGSTLPDHKQLYKYRELVISETAKILKLYQKPTNSSNFNKDYLKIQNNAKSTDESDSFVFAHPIEAIKVTLDFKGEKYTFKFSDPTNFIKQTSNQPDETENTYAGEGQEKEIREDAKVTKVKRHELCKSCWIFAKPQCKKCRENYLPDQVGILETNNILNLPLIIHDKKISGLTGCLETDKKIDFDTHDTIIGTGSINPCPHCWLFINVGQCEFCHKRNKQASTDTNTLDNYKSSVLAEKATNTEDMEAESLKTRKRTFEDKKTNATQDKLFKKTNWQCHICLTTNYFDRADCNCCESSKLTEETNKINFGVEKKATFEIPASDNVKDVSLKKIICEEGNNNVQEEIIIIKADEISKPDQCEVMVDSKFYTNNNLENHNRLQRWKEENNYNQDEIMIIKGDEISKLDQCEMMDTNSTQDVYHANDVELKYTELMDVTDEVNVYHDGVQHMMQPSIMSPLEGLVTSTEQGITSGPIVENTVFAPITASSLAFNMGSGVPEKRRHLKSMNYSCNYTGTKICQNCTDKAITSYLFINQTLHTRHRLHTCITTMLQSLTKMKEPIGNVLIELSDTLIVPIVSTELTIEDLYEENFDEDQLTVEVLEDKYRINSSSESADEEPKSLFKTSETSKAEFDDFPTMAVKKRKTPVYSYTNKKLHNGYRNKTVNKSNSCNDVSEFLTFKRKEGPKKVVQNLKYHCDLCSKTFISLYFLKNHVLRHINKSVQCMICNLECTSKFHLHEHTKSVHLLYRTDNSTCDICTRTFKDAESMKKHLKTHSKRQCSLCGKLFRNQINYNMHLQRHVAKYKISKRKLKQTCSFCESECLNKNKLAIHVNKVHLQIKPYACDMCDNKFYTKYNLENHKRLHRLKTKEKCEFCGVKFKSRMALVTHITKHMGLKPYSCLLCTETFYSEGEKNVHMKRIHKGKVICNVCKTVFANKPELKIHARTVHHSEFSMVF